MSNGAPKGARLLLILSSERSGSTLTRVILGAHSRIVAPQELFLMRYPDYRSWRRDKPVAIESMVEFFHLAGKPKSTPEIDDACKDLTIPQVYDWMLGFLEPDMFLLDKTPAYANDGATLRRSLVLSPFYVWLLRHPLGVIESHVRIKRDERLAAGGWKAIRRRVWHEVARAAARFNQGMTPLAHQRETKWVVQQIIIREFLATVPPTQQTRIRFEELVRDPDTVVNRLCEAIHIPCEPAMLDVIGEQRRMNVHLGDPNFHKHTRVESQMAEAWQQRYSESSLTLETRRLMDALGMNDR
jgi:LPS sulfotransferase NodH